MTKTVFISIALGMIFLSSCKQSDPAPRDRSLVWADEFDGIALDENKWEPMLGNGSAYGLWLWGNEEEQYYREENISVNNGTLKIAAVAQQFGGLDYTSARIRSLDKGDFKYGRIEASIRMSDAGGLWHAFWMLPSHPSESWPVSGEIDIMEYIGNEPDNLINTIHFADQFGNHNYLGQSTPFPQANAFHEYAIEWDENRIVWFLDSVETYSVLRTNSQISNTWPFDSEFHLLLNTAVGGNLGGTVDANALQSPKVMEVDYVRVYEDK